MFASFKIFVRIEERGCDNMDRILHMLMLVMNEQNENDTFHSLARNMIENIDKLASLSITEMAELCYVSPSTLSRFCRKLGYKNFNSFKNDLDVTYGFEIDYDNDYINLNLPLEKRLHSFQSFTIDSLKNINSQLKTSSLQNLAKQIHNSNNVFFFGSVGYQFLALYLQERLGLFKKIIYVTLDHGNQKQQALTLTNQDLAVVVSPHGRSNIQTIILPTLYKNKVNSILITQNPNANYIDKYNSVVLLGGTPNNNLGMISIMYFIDQLVLTYYSLYHHDLIV